MLGDSLVKCITQISGLASLISDQLGSLVSLPRPLLLAIFILVVALLTELMSNMAICNLMSPIAAAVVSVVLYSVYASQQS